MASPAIGRGRSSSRGRGLIGGSVQRAPLRKPGDIIQSVCKKKQEEDIISVLSAKLEKTLFINDEKVVNDEQSEELVDAVKYIKENSKNEQSLKEMVSTLHAFSTKDKIKAHIGGIICGELSQLEVNSIKFRNPLLEILQNEFQKVEALHSTKVDEFIAHATFLSEIFHYMRIADLPLKVLSGPVIIYLEMLLDGDSEMEIEVFVELALINGKELQICNPEGLNKMLMKLRRKIVTCSESSLRVLLLCVLETALNQWESLPDPIEDLYRSFQCCELN